MDGSLNMMFRFSFLPGNFRKNAIRFLITHKFRLSCKDPLEPIILKVSNIKFVPFVVDLTLPT